jgi:ATP-dependent Clp protease adapter protein ClpS
VVVTRVNNLTPERLAEQLQHAVHISGAIAWQLTEEIQKTGKALVFTGHPQDAEIVAMSLKTAGITVEVIDS